MPTLDWIGKSKVINHHLDVPYRVLDCRYTYTENGIAEYESENKIIRGDNLEALKALLPQYEGRIKCIYIDPPYNTGNEGWVYNDNVNDPKIKKWLGQVVGREGEDLSRHDKWLCLMYPRLKLLQRLLADNGAIFISIDSVELSNLIQICNEIFGLGNFVDTISWFKKASPSNDAQYFSNDIEYLVVYAKRKSNWKPQRLELSSKQMLNYTNPDNDPRGAWNSVTYTCNKSKDERPGLYYPIVNPNTGEEILPKATAVWKYGRETYEEHAKNGFLYWGVDGNAKFPRFKKFLLEHQGVVNRTFWHYDDVGHTQGATNEIKSIFGETKVFDTPKPTGLINRILKLSTSMGDLILDSFAGSGTTAHAVLNMNRQDGGNRKFILVEMMDYAETITAERVRRVIDGYADVEGTGGSFSFYDLGQPLLLENHLLNEDVPIGKIREYVFYMETKRPMPQIADADNPYYLGKNNETAYYFYYEKERVTTLGPEFLAMVNVPAEEYIIYADQCMFTSDDLKKYNIVFKKIPRDIAKL